MQERKKGGREQGVNVWRKRERVKRGGKWRKEMQMKDDLVSG